MKRIIALGVALALILAQAAALAEMPCAYFDEHGDHDWDQTDVSKPTCTEEGYYVLKCKVCGVTKKETTGPALGHDWQETDEKEESTCEKAGWVKVACSRCSATETMTLPLADHKWALKSETKATCDKKGSREEECTVCKKTRTSETNMLPHNFGSWSVTKQATDHSQGERTRTCAACGKKETERFYPEGTLYRGGKQGDEVKSLQYQLIAMGFLHDVADGIFGKNTEQAVKQLQLAEGLTADGIAWPQTISAAARRYQRGSSVQPQPTAVSPTAAPQPAANPTYTAPTPAGRPSIDGASCVYWSEGIGYEYVSCCETHTLLIMKTLHAMQEKDDAARQYMMRPALSAWTAAMEEIYADWATLQPEQTALIEAARDAFTASLDMHALLFPAQTEDALKWKLTATMTECTRLCAQLHAAQN